MKDGAEEPGYGRGDCSLEAGGQATSRTNLFSLYLDISAATINYVLWITIAKIKLHNIVLSTSTNLPPAKTLAGLLRQRGRGQKKGNFRYNKPFCELSR